MATSTTKLDILNAGARRIPLELSELKDILPTLPPLPPTQRSNSIHTGIEQTIVQAVEDAPEAVFLDNKPTDALSALEQCFKDLCDSAGGTYVDDDPNRAAGCYFPTYTQAAVYASLAWTCLPGGLIGWIFA